MTQRPSVRAAVRFAAAALVISPMLAACAGGGGVKKDTRYVARDVNTLYRAAQDRLDRRQYKLAAALFDEVERQHPYSEWSRRAILMTAYAHYQGNDYAEAIGDADRFISLYPGNPAAAYAHYLKAICYFEQIVDVGRDQAATGQALANLSEVVQRYPRTEYAADARLKIDMVNDQLAGKEMNIGRYYQRGNQPLAAIGRYKAVIDNEAFQRTSHTPEALYRLVEVNLSLGLTEEATRNAAVLGHNYPGSPWYAEAYALLNEQGVKPETEPTGKRESWLRRIIPG